MKVAIFTRMAWACALACASAEIRAESSVSFFGFVDAGIYKLADQDATVGTIQRSYWGLTGSEDLGDGVSALFTLSSRFETGTGRLEASGAQPLFYGESTVGLGGPWGKLRIGRAMSPMWTRDGTFDPWQNFDRVSSVAWYVFHPAFRSDPHHQGLVGDYNRLSNGVFYDSPTMAGWSAHFSAGVDRRRDPDANGDIPQKRSLGGSLNYDKGPVAAMLSAERNSADDRTFFLAGATGWGPARVMASVSLTDLSASSRTFLGETSSRRTSATLSATWLQGLVTYKLGLGRDFQGYGDRGQTDYLSLGSNYAWSPRTSLYVGLGHQMPSRHRNGTNVGVGLSHTF